MRVTQNRGLFTTFLWSIFPLLLSAQNFVVDDVLFWENADWEHTDVIYREAENKKTAWVVRRYYGARHDVREEFLRIDADNWLFNSYDTSGALRFRRGQLGVDRSAPRVDTVVTFDPETYVEHLRLDTTWRLREEGFWWEADSAGFDWTGEYAGGRRQGRWNKYRYSGPAQSPICDCRTVDYENGLGREEIQQNLALRADSTALAQALSGSWAHCHSPRLARWMKWDGLFPERCRAHHGSVIYYFLADGSVQACEPKGDGYFLTKSGRWRLAAGQLLEVDFEDGTSFRGQIRSLMNNEMLIRVVRE